MSTRTADRQLTEAKTEGAVTPIADANDAIAANRSVRYLRKDAVAAVPVGYIAPELTARRHIAVGNDEDVASDCVGRRHRPDRTRAPRLARARIVPAP